MSFVYTDSGHINRAHVVRIALKRNSDGVEVWALYDAEGRQLGSTVTDPMPDAAELIPAQPGYVLLLYWNDGDDDGITTMPVIAWRLDAGFLTPLVPGDNAFNDWECAIEAPGGAVYEWDGMARGSRDEWLAACREARKRTTRRTAVESAA